MDKNSQEIIVKFDEVTKQYGDLVVLDKLNLNIKKKIVYGYHHTLSSKEFTAWHSLETEWNSSFKPDFVISSGNISKNFLTSQGTPSKKIIFICEYYKKLYWMQIKNIYM